MRSVCTFVLISLMVLVLLPACSQSRSDVEKELVSNGSTLRLVVFTKGNIDKMTQEVNDFLKSKNNRIIAAEKMYNVLENENKKKAKALDIKQFPAYVLVDNVKIVSINYNFDENASVLKYYDGRN